MSSLPKNDLCPITSEDQAFKTLKKFTCKLYDLTTNLDHVILLREALFCKMTQRVECLPRTLDALLLHSNRFPYQAFIWARSDSITKYAITSRVRMDEGFGHHLMDSPVDISTSLCTTSAVQVLKKL